MDNTMGHGESSPEEIQLPSNYEQIKAQLTVPAEGPLLMKLLHLQIMELAKGATSKPEELAEWQPQHFQMLLRDLGYQSPESEM